MFHTGPTAWLHLFHLARSVMSSEVMSTARMSSTMLFIHHFLGPPRSRQPPMSKRSAVLLTKSPLLCMTWPYHLRRASLNFAVIVASLCLISLFITCSWRVIPSIHRSIFISIAWMPSSCDFVVGQQPAPYRATGRTAVLQTFTFVIWDFLIPQDPSGLSPLHPGQVNSCSGIGNDRESPCHHLRQPGT